MKCFLVTFFPSKVFTLILEKIKFFLMFYYIFLYILFYALLMSCFVKKRMYVVVSQNLNLQPSYPLLVTLSPELPVD